jgi:16S rRNA (guanine527-N7)-methyltransferase
LIRAELRAALTQGLKDLGEDPNTHPCEVYLDYVDLLSLWNRAYNLTAIRDPERMLTHHLLDSLAALPFLRGTDCLDAGSGAGMPGLILALARPDQSWVLLDGNKKKARYLNKAVLELKINNVEVAHIRIEDYRPDSGFTTIITRALYALPELYRLASPLLRADGRIIAMKGRRPEAELRQLRAAGVAHTMHALHVPGLNKQRHLVVMDVT